MNGGCPIRPGGVSGGVGYPKLDRENGVDSSAELWVQNPESASFLIFLRIWDGHCIRDGQHIRDGNLILPEI
jgi:hypothetical protein